MQPAQPGPRGWACTRACPKAAALFLLLSHPYLCCRPAPQYSANVPAESDVVTEAPDSHDDRCAACGGDQGGLLVRMCRRTACAAPRRRPRAGNVVWCFAAHRQQHLRHLPPTPVRRAGDLLLCDGCPAVYHPRCCGLRGVPSGDWFCPVCSDGRTPSHQHRARQRRQLQRSTAKTGAGAGAEAGGARQGGSRLRRQQAQQQDTPEGGSGGEEEEEDGWGSMGGGGGDTPSWDLL